MANQPWTKIYSGADLSGASVGVIYLPIFSDGTLETVDVLTDAAQSGDAVFTVKKNGVTISGLSALTIEDTEKIGTVSGLSVAVIKGDEFTLDLVSGTVSAPVTLNLSIDDGETSGGGSGVFESLIASNSPGAVADFTSVNSGATYATDSGGVIVLDVPGANSSTDLKALVKALPSGDDWTVEVGYTFENVGAGAFGNSGIVIMDSVSGKLQTVAHFNNDDTSFSEVLYWVNFTGATTADSVQVSSIATKYFRRSTVFYFLRLVKSATKLKLFESKDGKAWRYLTEIDAGTFLTANRAGFFVDRRHAGQQTVMRVFHFSIA